jgi:hypothetical protein
MQTSLTTYHRGGYNELSVYGSNYAADVRYCEDSIPTIQPLQENLKEQQMIASSGKKLLE